MILIVLFLLISILSICQIYKDNKSFLVTSIIKINGIANHIQSNILYLTKETVIKNIVIFISMTFIQIFISHSTDINYYKVINY